MLQKRHQRAKPWRGEVWGEGGEVSGGEEKDDIVYSITNGEEGGQKSISWRWELEASCVKRGSLKTSMMESVALSELVTS
jgi:general stress protein YciG